MSAAEPAMFSKVLIANRGEIAVRIAHTLRAMGIQVVAVFADPDRGEPHVRIADEAYPLEGATSGETYLRGDRIIEIAKQCGAEAIHPGFGFLSENAGFARECAAAGVTFIGPPPEAIAAMGDKMVAKRMMDEAGVPTVPGFSGDGSEDLATLRAEADRIGYPVLIKAAAGGGGKGMRVVNQSSEVDAAVEAAQREANAAFGDGRIFLERYVERARHIEFQVFGDAHGNAVHLFERECSIQRRHQKIIEEAPSPAVTPELRAKMGEAAVKAAQAIGYTNAGTVEFMLDDQGRFYFLEMNTRLQVEHPVTELTVHRDLVRDQVMVAAGSPLPYAQDDLRQEGHAIECRIYAEDADRGFLPSTGTLAIYEEPSGPGVRVDSGVRQGSTVTVHFDPMLAKLIVRGSDRAEAIARMKAALRRYPVLGVTTNIAFLRNIMDHPAFIAGDLHTRFLDEHPIPATPDDPPVAALLAAAITSLQPQQSGAAQANRESPSQRPDLASPWQTAGAWRAV